MEQKESQIRELIVTFPNEHNGVSLEDAFIIMEKLGIKEKILEITNNRKITMAKIEATNILLDDEDCIEMDIKVEMDKIKYLVNLNIKNIDLDTNIARSITINKIHGILHDLNIPHGHFLNLEIQK